MDDSDTSTDFDPPTTEHGEAYSCTTRRRFLTATATGSLGLVIGCSSRGDGPTHEGDRITDTRQFESSTESSRNTTGNRIESALVNTRSELDSAFTEIQSVGLVDHESAVWTPQYQNLGNMDHAKVEEHIASARDTLSRASNSKIQHSSTEARVKLLANVATVAQRAADFYYSFALTFEKIYQYEYLVETKSEFSPAVEKMSKALDELSEWPRLGKELADVVATISDISEANGEVGVQVESFELDKWNYVAFGAKEYARRMEPRLAGFEAYAEAYAADVAGVGALNSKEYQTAQDEFVTARETIRIARTKLEKSEERGSAFFEPRSRAFLDRIPLFEEGYLLHLRAANEFAKGNVEEANDLRFRGTTKIRDALGLYPVDDGDAQEETSNSG